MVMVASLSKSLKLCHLLPTSRLLNSRLTTISISNASLSSSSLPQSNPSSLFLSCLKIFVNEWALREIAKERRIFFKVLLFVPGAISFGLATRLYMNALDWQKVLNYRDKRLGMEPVTCAELPFFSNSMDSLYYRWIECEGDFDEKNSIFIGPYSATVSGSGEKVTRYDVITPFIPRKLAPGGVQTPVLVHRGWVPQELRDKIMSGEEDLDKASSSSLPSNTKDEKSTASWRNILSKKLFRTAKETAVAPPTVKINGVIMRSICVKPHMFLKLDPEGQWYLTDVPVMLQACGLSENAIYTIFIAETEEVYTSGAKSPYPVPHDISSVAVAGVRMMPMDILFDSLNIFVGSLATTCAAVWKVWKMKAKV